MDKADIIIIVDETEPRNSTEQSVVVISHKSPEKKKRSRKFLKTRLELELR